MAAPSKQSKIILGEIQLKYWGAGGCIPYNLWLAWWVYIYFVSSLQLSQSSSGGYIIIIIAT